MLVSKAKGEEEPIPPLRLYQPFKSFRDVSFLSDVPQLHFRKVMSERRERE